MPTKIIYLLGGGGHGRVALDAILSSGMKVRGILDPALKVNDTVFGLPVLGGDEILQTIRPENTLLVNGIGANSNVSSRNRLFKEKKDLGFTFCTICHPSAVLGRDCDLLEGAQIMAGAVLQNRTRIGENAVVNTGASVDHDSVIGAHVFISPRAVLCGGVTVAESAFIGAAAVILPGIEVGDVALIAAGAVVTKNVPARHIVAGNPAIKIGVKP